VNQNDDFEKAMREATRGVIEYVQTGRAPLASPFWAPCIERTSDGPESRETIENLRHPIPLSGDGTIPLGNPTVYRGSRRTIRLGAKPCKMAPIMGRGYAAATRSYSSPVTLAAR
jgi:hypothetical protein